MSNKISERYKTGLGEQAQFDYSPTFRIVGEFRRVYLFCMILGWSCFKYFVEVLIKASIRYFSAIEESFSYVGGLLCRLRLC